MLIRLIVFELRYHAKTAVFRATALVFLLLGLAMANASFGGGGVMRNAPVNIAIFFGIVSLGTVIPIALFAGGAILRDREHRMEAIIYTTSLTHFHYVVSRFAGLAGASFLAFIPFALTFFLGSLLPWVHPGALGPIGPGVYSWGLFLVALPNILLGTSLIFTIAALSKNSLATNIGGVFLYILYWAGSMLGGSPLMASSRNMAPENAELASLFEPYGLVAIIEQTRLWSVLQKNTQLLALEGPFLFNRLLWVGFSLSLFALAYRLFSFRTFARSKSRGVRQEPAPRETHSYRPVAPAEPGMGRDLTAYVTQARMQVRTVVKGYPFYMLLLLWTFFTLVTASETVARGDLGIPFYPYTGLLLPALGTPLIQFGSLVLVFFAAELMWRERGSGTHELLDTCPVSSTVFWAAKLTALAWVAFCLIAWSIVLAVAFQSFHGFFQWELGLYASLFPRAGLPLLAVGVLAMLMHSLIPNKYAAMGAGFLLIVLFSGAVLPRSIGLEHPMLRYAYTPEPLYSSMAATGYHDGALGWFLLYWCSAAGLLGTITLWFWRRGFELRLHRPGKGARVMGWVSLALFLGAGAFIYFQMHWAGDYRSSRARLDWREDYERNYAEFAEMPQPTITDVKLAVDLYPAQRSYRVRGRMTFENQTGEPLDKFLLGLSPEVGQRELVFQDVSLDHFNGKHGMYHYSFSEPFAVGGRGELHFSLEVKRSAFQPLNPENYVLEHASYVEVDKALPFFGYDNGRIIESRRERRERGLPEYQAYPVARDASPVKRNWVGYDLVVSTATEQTVIAPGTLQRSWQESGRSHFHFTMDRQIPLGIGIASAVYAHRETRSGNVEISAWYDPRQEMNVDSMLDSARDSLDYYQRHFGPYPDRELKIAELPSFSDRFGGTAYPNTIFAVENRAFLLHQSARTLDAAYRMMAHEIAHQWWGKQLTAAFVEGAPLLTEGLAVYSEMVVYEQRFGIEGTRRFLQKTNDLYFFMRGFQNQPELPLARVQFQPYVYYFKGAHVMYVLRELLGEETINQVLSQLLREKPYPQKPIPGELVDRLLAAAAPQFHDRIRELFDEVVTYDLKLLSVESLAGDDGQTEITARILATKTALNQEGEEAVTPVGDWVEVGLWRGRDLVQLDRVYLEDDNPTISIFTQENADRISLDPRGLRLESNTRDNRARLTPP